MLTRSSKIYKKLQKRYSRKINLNLSRINKVLALLNNPHLNLPRPCNFIGSDGKYSTLTGVKYFLEADNKRVTTFTSPHLYDVRHRFYLNKNKYISTKMIEKLIKVVEKTRKELTLFEVLTCIYVLAAKKQKKIFASLVEAGLLFKGDSSRIWNKPRAQIITNINFQHAEWVKPRTLTEICKQKVGFLSKKSVIYVGKQKPNTLKIIKNILKKNPSKIVYPSNWHIRKKGNNYLYKSRKNIIPIKSKYIFSQGLLDSLGLAIHVSLEEFKIKKSTIIKTIPKIMFEGRIQYLKKGKLKKILKNNEKLLLDTCHSEASAENLYKYLKTLKEPIYGIWGMQKNKEPRKFIKKFKNIFKKVITVTIPNEPNAQKANILKKICLNNKLKAETSTNIIQAIKNCLGSKKKTIVIFGSNYLIGYVLSKN
tara:strand:+ start:498 stop:1766 length:1269 start_codon:yes stop_codon:yes gene_type:complete